MSERDLHVSHNGAVVNAAGDAACLGTPSRVCKRNSKATGPGRHWHGRGTMLPAEVVRHNGTDGRVTLLVTRLAAKPSASR